MPSASLAVQGGRRRQRHGDAGHRGLLDVRPGGQELRDERRPLLLPHAFLATEEVVPDLPVAPRRQLAVNVTAKKSPYASAPHGYSTLSGFNPIRDSVAASFSLARRRQFCTVRVVSPVTSEISRNLSPW